MPRTKEQQAAFERALKVMGDLYASAVGTTVLRCPQIPARPPSFDGALCLFDLQLTEQGKLRTELGRFGEIVSIDLSHRPPLVRFATHQAALDAKVAKLSATICSGVDTLYNERPYIRRGW